VTATASIPNTNASKTTGIGSAVAKGAFWTVLCAVGAKVISLGSQVVAARFLTPAEFGYAATALSVVTIISAFLASNLQRVLVQREAVSASTLAQAFWLGLAMNTAAALLLAASAPFAAAWFEQSHLRNLILLISAAVPVMGLHVVYSASLSRSLQFRTLSLVQLGQGLVQNGAVIILAATGWREYALIAPLLPAAAFAALAVRWSHGPIALERPRWSEWKSMLNSSRWVMVLALVTALQGYGLNLVVASVLNAESTGLLFWASTLSSQFVFLLCSSLQSVLFPALSRMSEDPTRLQSAFTRSARVMLLLLTPVLALQLVLVEPIIPLIFGEKWSSAAALVQWLTLGALTQPLQVLASSALMSAGKFRHAAVFGALQAVSVAAVAGVTGSDFGVQACAAAVGTTAFCSNILVALLAVRALGLTSACVWSGLEALLKVGAGITLVGALAWASSVAPTARVPLAALAVFIGWAAVVCLCAPFRADLGNLVLSLRRRRPSPAAA
jgi:O-antigen/teichoic acid export membrane protein